jgi:hypothetical protein
MRERVYLIELSVPLVKSSQDFSILPNSGSSRIEEPSRYFASSAA